jgi:hypothetical protein
MKFAPKILVKYSFLALALGLWGCTDAQNASVIDPAGNLNRNDYLALRDRQPTEAPKPPAPPIPDSSVQNLPPPIPGEGKKISITVNDTLPLKTVLMELARKANVNLELDPNLRGNVIFTAHEQPFDVVLKRICAMARLRYSVDGNFIHIENDEPYQHTYALDYLSLSRRATSETSISTNVFDVDVADGTNGSTKSGTTDNNSSSKIAGSSDVDFWGEVERSLKQIIDSNKRKSDDKEKDSPNFSLDKQAGLLRACSRSFKLEMVEEVSPPLCIERTR